MMTYARRLCRQSIHAGAVSPNVPGATQHALAQDTPPVPSKGDKVGVGSTEHYAPEYNPRLWNSDCDVILRYNNCYNYANQKITNSFAQPGFVEGYSPQMTPEDLIHATELDGLVKMNVDPSAPCPEAPPQPNCLIALMCWEGKELLKRCCFLIIISLQISKLLNHCNMTKQLEVFP